MDPDGPAARPDEFPDEVPSVGLPGADLPAVVARLGLEPHPEGGWYRRTFLDPQGRASSILYLLGPGARSRWHRVRSTELWSFCAGDPLTLEVSTGGAVESARLGSGPGARPQVAVEPGAWQRAVTDPAGPGTLVTCVVVPAFRWDDFELAPDGWEPGGAGVGTGSGRR